ncbi:hypothetical protein FACS1894211_16370 [Clostridia bacterium]|nr:hypothetical protein FACS1894211_16370 [Clostridia bacterium]
MNKLHVKKGDTVKVLAGGANKKKTGKVLEVFPHANTVVVEDVNILIRHKKAKSAQDQGGRIKMPGPINVSNVMVVCPACNAQTRVNYKVTEEENGKKNKVRVCKKCGAVLDAKVESVKAKKERKEKEKAARKEKKEKKAKAGKEEAAEAPVEESKEKKNKKEKAVKE